MSETGKREQPRARKSYAKPVVRRVHLKPEEAVLVNCKTGKGGNSGPGGGNCGGGKAPCSAQGS